MSDFIPAEDWLPAPNPRDIGTWIGEQIVGSCTSGPEMGIEILQDGYGYPASLFEGKNEIEILQAVYDITFNCNQCGWWCWVGDEEESDFGELICSQCSEENNDT